MTYLPWIMLAVVVFLLAWRAHLAFWRQRLSVPMSYTHHERIVMPDGGAIELRRIYNSHLPTSALPPVLLVHGIAVNHRNNDAFPERSFARFLSAQGRDVWLLTLRSGQSPGFHLHRRRHAFQAMCDYDLPRGVAEVLARTGHEQLDLSCYSMGGMVLYAALGRSLCPSLVRRALVFASPGAVRPLGPLVWMRYLPRSLTPSVPLRLVARTLAFAHARLPRFTLHVFYNPSNVPARLARSSMMDLFEDIPGALGADFVRWAADGGRLTLEGKPVLDGLHRVRVPVCFFAGTQDFLAPVQLVRAAYDAWGRDVPSVHKHFLLLGRHTGTREEYGHGDFAFGTHAHEEVFAPALEFLDAVDTALAPCGVVLDRLPQPQAHRHTVEERVGESSRSAEGVLV